MRTYRKLTGFSVLLMVLLVLTANVLTLHFSTDSQNSYRVEIFRAAREIHEQGLDHLELSRYPSLVRVTAGEGKDFLEGTEEDYAVREIDGVLYRFDYKTSDDVRSTYLWVMNLSLLFCALFLFAVLHFIGTRIIKPFESMRNLPAELAKGNLTAPLRQQKSRYFGNFLWGMDLLREKLEQQKEEELKLQKEKKSLILSLTHDIKTPLSAIKLYAKALERNLYQEPEKQLEVANKIGQKADEIEVYIEEITQSSREDFLHLEVHNGEFYLKEIEMAIHSYYDDKLNLLKIPYTMDFGGDCLLKGDRDRCAEIMQNLMENAIKYGLGEEICIFSAEESGYRILTVRSACCLKKEELPHIFESFWRGSNSEQVAGSGLGLYICRQLASKMGGDVFAELNNGHINVSLVLPKV